MCIADDFAFYRVGECVSSSVAEAVGCRRVFPLTHRNTSVQSMV